MNNIKILEIDNETRKSLQVFWLIFGTILLGIIIYIILTDNETTKNQILNLNRHTRVEKIYINVNEHNFTYVRFSNGKEKILEYPYEIGDSISKKKNDSIEYIFRNGNVIKYNMLEYYRKAYEKKL